MEPMSFLFWLLLGSDVVSWEETFTFAVYNFLWKLNGVSPAVLLEKLKFIMQYNFANIQEKANTVEHRLSASGRDAKKI